MKCSPGTTAAATMDPMDKATAWRLAATARVASLATVGPDAHPHLVPCVFALDGDTVYTPVDAKPKRSRDLQRVRHLERDPAVVLLVQGWDEDWSRLWWVRLQGRGRIATSPAEVSRARLLLLDKYAQYRDEAELDPVIGVDIDGWRGLVRIARLLRINHCLLYTSPSPRDLSTSRMPSSA